MSLPSNHMGVLAIAFQTRRGMHYCDVLVMACFGGFSLCGLDGMHAVGWETIRKHGAIRRSFLCSAGLELEPDGTCVSLAGCHLLPWSLSHMIDPKVQILELRQSPRSLVCRIQHKAQ